MSQIVHDALRPTYDALKDYAKGLVYPWDIKLIDRAFELAALGHKHQLRQSGELYIYHPLAVARIVASLQCDSNTFIAAILHDVVEDTNISLAQIRDEFGHEVAFIVDSVTKIPKPIGESSSLSKQAESETLRKTIVGIAKDLRVAYIKLADRLHNLMTLRGKPPNRRSRTVEETRYYFGPLARELGITHLYNLLRKWTLIHASPDEYNQITNLSVAKQDEYYAATRKIWREVNQRLRALGITATQLEIPLELALMNQLEFEAQLGVEFTYHSSYSASTEIVPLIMQLTLLFDTTASRYLALEAIHSLWPTLYSRFGDWVAYPQSDGYSAIHTLVSPEQGQLVEFRLQTNREHRLSKLGPLFELCRSIDYQDSYHQTPQARTLNNIIEIDRTVENTIQFLEYMQFDILKPKIRVFTASGKQITLPSGATILDMAYSLLPEKGYQCVGAIIKGEVREIRHVLRDGDIIRLLVNDGVASPDSSWSFGREFNTLSTRYAIEKAR